MVSINYVILLELNGGAEFRFFATTEPRAKVKALEEQGFTVRPIGATSMTYQEAKKCIWFMKNKMRLSDFQYWAKQRPKLIAVWMLSAGGGDKRLANDQIWIFN